MDVTFSTKRNSNNMSAIETLTYKINLICIKLEIDMFITPIIRKELLKELEQLIDKRKCLEETLQKYYNRE